MQLDQHVPLALVVGCTGKRRAIFQVDVFPPQGEDLADSPAGHIGRDEQGSPPRRRR